MLSQPRVRAYMMGANQWRTYDSWPVKEAHDVAYYLDSDGGANTRSGRWAPDDGEAGVRRRRIISRTIR